MQLGDSVRWPELYPVSVALSNYSMSFVLPPSPCVNNPHKYVAETHLNTWVRRDNVEQT